LALRENPATDSSLAQMKSNPSPPSRIQQAIAALAELAQAGARIDIRPGNGDTGSWPAPANEAPSDAEAGDARVQRAEARYRGLIEQIPAVTFLAQLTGGRNEMYVSPQIESLLGFTQAEWLNDPVLWYRQTHPADRERVSKNFATTCFTGKPFKEVFRVLTKTGETVWVDAAAKLVRDAQGGLLFLQGVGFDVTDQHRAAEARDQLLREQMARAQADRDRTRLREMFINLPAALWLLDGEDHRVEIMNPIAQRTFSVGPDMLGRPFREVFPDLAEHVLADLDDIRRGDRLVLRKQVRVQSPEWGRPRYFDFVSQPLEGYERGLILAHASETTEQVEAQRQIEEALRLRDEFMAVAAHELRTPITSVMGQSQLALRQLNRDASMDKSRISRSLEVIARQASKLSQLIAQLLDISRLESGKLTIDRERADLVPVVSQVVDNARLLGTPHDLSVEAPPLLEADVDALRFEQVVTNLVTNAIKYSPEGGAIDVVLRATDRDVELSVRDHGLGVPPEKRPRIFERFYQAHGDSHQQGLGLGLYIGRQIVELHGGNIRAEFPGDGGSRFIVTLPLRAPEGRAATRR
jgi:PAS domain S-box-containing protein